MPLDHWPLNPNLHYDEYHQRQCDILNDQISKQEISTTLDSFKTHKNPGPGPHVELLLFGGNVVISFLHWLYNLFFKNQYIPKIFKLRYIKPICKPGRDSHVLYNYRQISLFGYTGKLYEKLYPSD